MAKKQIENIVASSADATDVIIVRRGSGTKTIQGVLLSDITAGSAVWGGIGGTLSAQTDLQAALDLKANAADLGTAAAADTGDFDAAGTASAAIATHVGLADPHTQYALEASLGTLATQNGTFSGTSSGTNTGDQTITLTGEVTGSGTGTFAATLTNSAVIGKVLTGFTSGAGTVAATDTILQAIQKIDGNIGALAAIATSGDSADASVDDSAFTVIAGTDVQAVLADIDSQFAGESVEIATTDTGTQQNWAPTGLAGQPDITITWSGTSPILIGGIVHTSGAKRALIINTSSESAMVLQNEASGSTAANRITIDPYGHTHGIILPHEAMALEYNGANSRWEMVAAPSGGIRDVGFWRSLGPSSGTGGSSFGSVATQISGSLSTPTPASTNYSTSLYRRQSVTAAAINSQAGIGEAIAYFWRGNAAGLGGGLVHMTIIPVTRTTGDARYFGVKETPSSGFGPTVDPSSGTNIFGYGHDAADSNLQGMTNDASGTATKVDLGSGYALSTSGAVFEGWIYAAPNGSSMTRIIWRKDDGTVAPVVEQISTDLPSSTAFMGMIYWSSSRANAVALGIATHAMESWTR